MNLQPRINLTDFTIVNQGQISGEVMSIILDTDLRLTHPPPTPTPPDTLLAQIQNYISYNLVSRHQPVHILAVFPIVVNSMSQCASSW